MAMVCLGIASMIYFIDALLDFLYYRLPNKLFYGLFYLFPLYAYLLNTPSLLSHYSAFLVFLLIGFGLFMVSIFDAGDAKLLAVSALWLGWTKLIPFLLVMALIGGGIGLVYFFHPLFMHSLSHAGRHLIKKQPSFIKVTGFFINDLKNIEPKVMKMQEKRLVPYGIAIACAALLSLWGVI